MNFEKKYESPAEELFAPYIANVGKELNMEYDCQLPICETVPSRFHKWVKMKCAYFDGIDYCSEYPCKCDEGLCNEGLPEWLYKAIEEHDSSGCNSDCEIDHCKYRTTPYSYEKYRLDFSLINKNLKLYIDIEVDGIKWHDPVVDIERDEYMESKGWQVIRFPASDTMHDPIKASISLKQQILKFLWNTWGDSS